MTLTLTAGQTVVATVDGWTAGQEGAYDLAIFIPRASELGCTDGIDDDLDTFVDCADDDCETEPVCLVPCPEVILPATVPSSTPGSTTGALANLTGSCGVTGPSADVSHRFVAPTAGTYAFDTEGSLFDTTLYVRTSCTGGAALGCNDDDTELGLASRLTVSLTAGQIVYVIVDGYDGAHGAYVLNVDRL